MRIEVCNVVQASRSHEAPARALHALAGGDLYRVFPRCSCPCVWRAGRPERLERLILEAHPALAEDPWVSDLAVVACARMVVLAVSAPDSHGTRSGLDTASVLAFPA